MSLDKLVDSVQLDASLTSVAAAIRAKGGTSGQLQFPQGFVDAVEAIETGSGPTVDDLVAGTWPSGDITITATLGRTHTFFGVSGIRKVKMTYSGRTGNADSFFSKSGITEFVGLDLLGLYGNGWFSQCISLAKITIPKATYYEYLMCHDCANLLVVDIGGGSISRGNIFDGCKKLQTIIIRGTTVCSLGNVSNLSKTPFYPNGGIGVTGTGTLYVPASLVESYKTATNWSTLFDAGTMDVQPIEGSIYETAYADGTPIS